MKGRIKTSDGFGDHNGMKRDRKSALLDDRTVNQMLRSLPQRTPPAELRTSLRVMASREHRRRFGLTWLDRIRLLGDNLMRPLALPFAGGIASALVLFSMFVPPMYSMRASNSFDVPTGLTTGATVKFPAQIESTISDVVVDVTIDSQGRMIDYTVVSGQNMLDDAYMRRNLENVLLFTTFNSGTSFGQPTPCKMRLSLRRTSPVDVKG